jgi:hypothetical protein
MLLLAKAGATLVRESSTDGIKKKFGPVLKALEDKTAGRVWLEWRPSAWIQ